MSSKVGYYREEGVKVVWEPKSYKCAVTGKMTDRTNIHIENVGKKSSVIKISPEGLHKLVNNQSEITYDKFDKNSIYQRLEIDNKIEKTLDKLDEVISTRHVFKDLFLDIPSYIREREIDIERIRIMTEEDYYSIEEFREIVKRMKNKEKNKNIEHNNPACFYCLTKNNLITHEEGNSKYICKTCLNQLVNKLKSTLSAYYIVR